MKEVIKSIGEVENVKIDNEWGEFDGFKIVTDIQEILVLINNYQNCCESWGYFDTLDDSNDFIGSELLDIEIIDTDLKNEFVDNLKQMVKAKFEGCVGYEDSMFVNFITSVGKFQIVVYNAHNGYYGHNIKIISKQLNYNGNL